MVRSPAVGTMMNIRRRCESFHHRWHELTVGGEGRYQKERCEDSAPYPYNAEDDVNETKN